MSEIYDLLSKHFHGEVSPSEEQEVQQFKKDNPQEYDAYAKLWKTEGIRIKEYDSQTAWAKVAEQATSKINGPAKEIPLYRRLVKVASIAAVFFLTTFLLGKYAFQPADDMLFVQTDLTERSKKVALPDGSIIHLNRNSSLSYPEKFANNLRSLTLDGQAFFEVSKDPSRPFVIKTNHSTVEVLGTSFNIDTDPEKTEIDVATGKVKVESNTTEKSLILTPNQSAVVTSDLLESYTTKDKNYMAWKTGEFTFDSASITDVVESLKSYYGSSITLSATSDCLLTSSFDQASLSEVMEVIQLSCNLKTKKDGNHYDLY